MYIPKTVLYFIIWIHIPDPRDLLYTLGDCGRLESERRFGACCMMSSSSSSSSSECLQ